MAADPITMAGIMAETTTGIVTGHATTTEFSRQADTSRRSYCDAVVAGGKVPNHATIRTIARPSICSPMTFRRSA